MIWIGSLLLKWAFAGESRIFKIFEAGYQSFHWFHGTRVETKFDSKCNLSYSKKNSPYSFFYILKHSPYSFFGFCRLLSGSTPHNFQLVPDGFWRKKHPRSIFFVEKGVESRRFLLNRQFERKTRWNRSRTTWWMVFSSGRVIYNKDVPIEEMNHEICKWFSGLFKMAWVWLGSA